MVVGAVAMLLSGVVYGARPGRSQNRWLALTLFLLGSGLIISRGLYPGITDPDLSQAAVFTFYVGVCFVLPCYLMFLSTIESPFARPLRRAPARASAGAVFGSLLLSMFAREDLWFPRIRPGNDLTMWIPDFGPLALAMNFIGAGCFVLGLVVALSAYRRARGATQRRQMGAYLAAFAVHDALLVIMIAHFFTAAGHPPLPRSVAWSNMVLPTIATAWLVAALSYGILSAQLFDIDLKIKWTIRRSTVAAAFLAVFFVVATVASEFLTGALGYALGGVVAGLLLFALAPIQRMAERVADRAMPGVRDDDEYRTVRKREVYRAAIESALADGEVTLKERAMLATLQDELGLAAKDALAIEREAAGAARGVA